MKACLLLLLLLLGGLAEAQQAASKVETSLEKTGPIAVGEMVILHVDLLAPGYFFGAAVFDLPRIPGTLILPPLGSPAVGSREIEGVEYTTQRHELYLFPRKEGDLTVPTFEIRFAIKRSPLDKEEVAQSVKTAPITFKTTLPPGMPPGSSPVSSADLKVEETWKPVPGTKGKLGDAFVRSIRWTASDVPGMAFPPLDPGRIQGLGIYAAEPMISDTSDRGDFHGERMDSVTYVVKSGGHFVIPALKVTWWDPSAKAMKQVDFPERAFDVPIPPVPPEKFTAKVLRLSREYGVTISLAVGGLLGLGMIAWFSRHALARFGRRLLPRHLAPLNPRG